MLKNKERKVFNVSKEGTMLEKRADQGGATGEGNEHKDRQMLRISHGKSGCCLSVICLSVYKLKRPFGGRRGAERKCANEQVRVASTPQNGVTKPIMLHSTNLLKQKMGS